MVVKNSDKNSSVLYSNSIPVVSGDEAVSVICTLEHELYKAGAGALGIAAPQVGISKSLAIIRYRGVAINLINPSIISVGEEFVSNGEGCLSLPNRRWDVPRFKTVKIKNHILWPSPAGPIPLNSNPNGISFLNRSVNAGMFLVPVEQVFVYENPVEDFGGIVCVAVQHEEEHLRGILLDTKDGTVEDFSLATGVNKIGRNDPCGCGSGKKFKKCCLAKVS